MRDNIGIIEDYLAWRTSHDGESRAVSPTAYYEHLENLKNAEKLEQIRKLNIGAVLHDVLSVQTEAEYTKSLMDALENVLKIVNGETDD